MKCNMSPLDASIRSGLGMFLLASPLVDLPTYPWSLLGIVPLVTGLLSYCPLYSVVQSVLPSSSSRTGGHAQTHV